MQLRNWSGNVTFSTGTLLRPTTVAELQELVARTPRVRALGTGHSFSAIADTTGALVTVADLAGDIDLHNDRVSFPAGMRYGELVGHLDKYGRALHNLGSLPHISVAGACATGTHGSGDTNGSLATAVRAVEFVAGTGELVRLDEGDPDFPGAVLSLGALGIATRLTLQTEPGYDVRQDVYLDAPLDTVLENLDDVMGAAYSVSVFTDWRRPQTIDKIWLKSRTPADVPDTRWGGRLADQAQHPITGEDTDAATQQLGLPGPWNERLPHFRLEHKPSHGDELQSEWFVPRAHGPAAIAALREIAAVLAPALLVNEIRTVAADELWLSPSRHRDNLALHFTWRPDVDGAITAVRAVQDAIAPFAPRPHWGKVYDLPSVADAYPGLPGFRELVERYDPQRRFANAYLEKYVY